MNGNLEPYEPDEVFDWIEQSKFQWETDTKPGNEKLYWALGIGCLQRIASSLEQIERHLNVDRRRENRKAEARVQEKAKRWETIRPILRLMDDKVKVLTPGLDSEMRRRVGWAVGAPLSKKLWSWYEDGIGELDAIRAEVGAWLQSPVELPEVVAGSKTIQARYQQWLDSRTQPTE